MAEMTETTLWLWSASGLQIADVWNLKEEIGNLKEEIGTLKLWGFTYTPQACRFFRVRAESGMLVYHDGKPVRLAEEAFEARMVCEHWELRWKREGKDGRLALLTESGVVARVVAERLAGVGISEGPTACNMRYRDHKYLLWGRYHGHEDGWTCLSSARIGPLWVPWKSPEVETERGIALRAREYFHIAEDGNVVFAHERLLGFALARRPDRVSAEQIGTEERLHV